MVDWIYVDWIYVGGSYMASGFVGRRPELALLRKRLALIGAGDAGLALIIRGRRQVGKSRLAQEFCDRAEVPYLFYTATKGASPVEAVTAFLSELRESGLPRDRDLVPAEPTASWADAFRALAGVLPDSPAIVVLDELPWLAEQDETFDGALQAAWDRLLSRRPVLLLLLGSDLHMMERLTAYDRPFFGRADNLLLGPLNPAEVGQALSLPAVDALDAYLLSGGLPGILRAWPDGMPAVEFAARECADPASPLFGVPEAALLAEFPAPDVTRRVLEAVGGGNRTHSNIAAEAGSRAGAVPSGTLTPILRRLVESKHVLAIDEPLSVRSTKPALYRVADTSLRFYLSIGRSAHELSRRGRATPAAELIRRRWASWRGRAVEPIVQEALSRAAAELPWPEAVAVGGWWNRAFDPEVDLVGADRAPVASQIFYVGSIKWLDRPFGRPDLTALQRGAPQVPGAEPGTVALVGVSCAGFADTVSKDLALCWQPEDVIGSFASY
jgi:AAA+ ATPase superfamily predicted ATPase